MKKLILIALITFAFSSCKTVEIGTGQPNFTLENGTLCYDQNATATIPEDSLFILLKEGFVIGNDSIGVKISYANGVLKASPHACIKVSQ